MMDRDAVVTPREVEVLIAKGGTIVIFDELVLNLGGWLKKHPGGRLAILHMVGKDATDEIKAYHSYDTIASMGAFRIGRKPAGPWPNMTPPIRGGIYHDNPDAEPSDAGSETSIDRDSDAATDVDDRDSQLASSISSECSSLAGLPSPGASELRKRLQGSSSPDKSAASDFVRRLSPAEYTEWAMQQNIEQDEREYPTLEPAKQQFITRKYRELHQKVHDMGYYKCPPTAYAKECVRYAALFTTFILLLRSEYYLLSAVFLGLFWHQIMFTAHDAGHCAITHIYAVDTLIAIFIADFCCGLSMGWWKSSHNVHHLITNHPEHDPDIQNLPLFATCPSFFKSLRSTYYDFTFVWDKAAEILVPYQKYTYYPIMGIARFNLYLLSWLHVFSSKSSTLGNTTAWWIRPTEIAFMTCYWILYGYCLVWRSLPNWTIRVAFTLICHMFLMPLHVQITLSHWGMSTSDIGEQESFAQRQLRTTMDVDCPRWMDFFHGGLQFQAIHHLFPRVPRHNLRKVQVLVKQFCEETAIPYSILSFYDGNQKVLNRLDEVGQQVSMLVNCQKYLVETGQTEGH
ncbi:hypothetical protein S7711_04424 [Stachybotrys chartarum IBT 7711]|uniref:Delta 8-(E)-sphingolipid desaturase n=1 Tax=Stachybotrys chartarum (strain CBS 109288 / IBT 7711) TaxID=1280523 RepID=A0A084B5L4_STACB|nr:hypothetical protein S7711_04424 [Stachybotrys chartarum IBT 7711]KFA53346.1 hypothetical protein S40293_06660 [Stachybotrys chartarum IBT 40293]KFA73411.1 hypothetical protein S40288_04213 [Stachybotrys chartarum IBT 40288]